MKLTKITQLLIAIALVLSQALAFTAPVHAQEGENPWDNVFDGDGNLLPTVVDLGEYEQDPAPAWWPQVPDWMDFVPTYHQYVTANGEVVVVPSASTLFLMTLNPEASGLTESYGYIAYGPGAQLLNIMQATQGGQGILERMGELGYTDPNAFADAIISGEVNIFTFAFAGDALRMLRELVRVSGEDFMFATTYLLYIQGTCANSPTGCPANLCQIAPAACQDDDGDGEVELPPSCPQSTVTPGTVYYEAYKIEPANPLVVGQDPDRRGIDVLFHVEIGPTVYEYYIMVPVIEDVDECYVPDGGYGGTLNCKTDDALPANNGYWRTTQEIVDFECEQHIQTYAEPIAGAAANAYLSQTSQAWIEGGLAAYYYGAEVYQNAYSLFPTYGVLSVGCGADQVCRADGTALRVPVRDPGMYRIDVTVQTAGTPVTTGRTINGGGTEFNVFLISAREIEVSP
ncbi:MAG TPA: hypothetical protein PKW33_00665 [Anaerolineaceae bacterium]|nr:hypothetical protein [Anaerolineaceae bacterium]HPN50069.1 hypothetical protein [Anaerolineaceae bacterium]